MHLSNGRLTSKHQVDNRFIHFTTFCAVPWKDRCRAASFTGPMAGSFGLHWRLSGCSPASLPIYRGRCL